MFIYVFAIVVLFILHWSWKQYEFLKIGQKIGVPTPPTRWPLGHAHLIMDYLKKEGASRMIYLRDVYAKKYGPTFGLALGVHFELSTTDKEIIEQVFIKQFHKFVDRPTEHFNAGFPMNENLLQMGKAGAPGRGYGWKTIRSVVSPIFTTGKLKMMFPVMHERVGTFLDLMSVKAKHGEVDMFDELQALTLDVIGRCAFGIDSDCINDRKDVFFIHATNFFSSFGMEKSWGFMIGFLFPKLSQMLRFMLAEGRNEKVLMNTLRDIIRRRKQNWGKEQRTDLIKLLLEQDEERQKSQNKPPLHIDSIASNCYAFLLAGYETTSTALSFACYALAKYPEVQQRLHEELIEEFGEKGHLDYDRVIKSTYLDAFYKEVLRRYPPVVFFSERECIEETTLKGWKIPVGTCIGLPVHSVNWNEENWPEPLKFDPDRFLTGYPKDPLDYVPFGVGPRICVGMRFAELEFKSTIADLVRRFKLELGDDLVGDKELRTCLNAVLFRPSHGVPLKLKERHEHVY